MARRVGSITKCKVPRTGTLTPCGLPVPKPTARAGSCRSGHLDAQALVSPQSPEGFPNAGHDPVDIVAAQSRVHGQREDLPCRSGGPGRLVACHLWIVPVTGIVVDKLRVVSPGVDSRDVQA